MLRITTLIAAAALAAPAMAQDATGDVANGEDVFGKRCIACHIVQSPDGEMIAGRGRGSAPNLYGVVGRTAGTTDFRYGSSMVEAGEAGLVWTQEALVAYVPNPNEFLREFLGNNRARGNMANQRVTPEELVDIYAYLSQFGAVEAEDGEEAEDSGS